MSEYQDYHPQPVDTSQVDLPEGIIGLTELLARNAHEVWAHTRLADGWRWGPARDDEKRQHPCLVPYEDLPESEKEYDRVIAIQTLKTILALGFRLTRE